ncbi:hypothetical protein WPS_13430 [Vulcanimicrobium alpinum]|uniref:Uncharacterized protein n=1 Tax=Vulcanimicrobium alpinum TaxID=3016050 RepID=A0AAN1XXH2_UNVUL|nr:DUF4127 family protein [Vulcanimicrobium alpinum]BDE06067.1 hypothetical protein WPS_13430 [Vulcanimicrobium alpinum]
MTNGDAMHSIAALFSAVLALTFVVVPLDDRPVTAQLPKLLGAIAGVQVVEPPVPLLGRYLTPGDPDAILRWLRSEAPADARAYIVSNDMAVYGGLVASRIPGVSRALAYTRVSDLASVRASRPAASFAVFGTVMRLAPTGVPATGGAKTFPFAGDVWPLVQTYANLPDPPQTAEQQALAVRLRARLGTNLDAYLATRARNRDVDLFALRTEAEGGFDRVLLGQDDAGPVGLHLRDLAALRRFSAAWLTPARASIEPGADELAMVLEGAALAREARVVPRVRVIYSRADGGTVNDPLEFAPIATTIDDIIRSCGARQVAADAAADVDLFVRVPATSDADEQTFVARIAGDAPPRLRAIADLSFLTPDDYVQQRRLTGDLIDAGVAGSIDAFASWNTVANTVGTALPEAIAVIAGRRLGTYDARAHATFTLMRYVDDVAFHTVVRPKINDDLSAGGIDDHTYLEGDVARRTDAENRALLWPAGLDLLARIAAQYRDAGFTITLPWDRTFETKLDVRLAPKR